MAHPAAHSLSPRQVADLLLRHRRMWIAPMVALAVLAGVVSLVTPRKWKATQGLLIRPEAAGLGADRLGKFADLSEMKTIQETLLELARSRTVVTAVLEKVGPRSTWTAPKNWPTPQDIADFRDAMVMTPPGGAEFGKTEVFYLGVLDKDPERAAALTVALAEALENRTQEIRQTQADSMIAELTEGLEQSQADLSLKIARLSDLEGRIGANLNDLRNLVNPIGGASETSQNNLAIEAEIRANEAQRRRTEKLLAVLRDAQADPTELIATPNSLLASQPAVERIKQGLVDSQLATARLLGKLAPEHPFVAAARHTETKVREQLRSELGTAISGLEIELSLSADRNESLNAQLATNRKSQQQLAQHRAAYSQLVAAVANQTQLVDAARTRLADAEGHLAGAQSASVLSRIDAVESSLRPVGPRRSVVVATGGLLGLLVGLSLVYLKHGPAPKSATELDAAAPQQRASWPTRRGVWIRQPACQAVDFERRGCCRIRRLPTTNGAIAAFAVVRILLPGSLPRRSYGNRCCYLAARGPGRFRLRPAAADSARIGGGDRRGWLRPGALVLERPSRCGATDIRPLDARRARGHGRLVLPARRGYLAGAVAGRLGAAGTPGMAHRELHRQ